MIAIAVTLLAVASSLASASFYDESTSVASVASTQLFAKQFSVKSFRPYPIRTLFIDTPGRVFLSYAANSSADGADVFAKINVSGTTREIVELFEVAYIDGGITSDRAVKLHLTDQAKAADALLVEVELLRKNAIKTIHKSGESDLVAMENVLYSTTEDPFLLDTSYISSKRISVTLRGGNGSIFIADDKSTLFMDMLDIAAFGGGNIQLEAKALHLDSSVVTAGGAGNVTLFVDEMDSIVDASVGKKSTVGSVCISTKNGVNVTIEDDTPGARVSYTGKQGGDVECVRHDLPQRTPWSTSGSVNSTSSQTTTTAPAPSATSGGSHPRDLTLLALAATLLSLIIS